MKRASSVENSYYIDVYIVGLSASQGKQVYRPSAVHYELVCSTNRSSNRYLPKAFVH